MSDPTILYETLSTQEMLMRAGLAAGLGLCIGWDREKQNKAAGLRTMSLVALGSAGVMLVAVEMAAQSNASGIQIDPTRVASGVIGGVGFLGAGSIIQSGGKVRGMTTAALIWAAAAIGVAAGLGLVRLALVLFGLVAFVMLILSPLKGRVLPDSQSADGPQADSAG